MVMMRNRLGWLKGGGGDDSLRVLETTKDTGSGAGIYEAYVWCERFVHAPICRFRDTNADGTADETLYATTDANFNITALVNTAGTVVERFVYDPYGKVSIRNNDATWTQKTNNASGYDWVVLYTGHKLDVETGNYYGNARYYNPELGRWLSRDPLGYIDGENLYEYCGSFVLNYLDILGATRFQTAKTTDRKVGNIRKMTGLKEEGYYDKDVADAVQVYQKKLIQGDYLKKEFYSKKHKKSVSSADGKWGDDTELAHEMYKKDLILYRAS
jgi:RHS repeat-associated protein